MHPVLPLLRKEFASFTRHRSAIIVTFLVPVILIYIFGFVFGLNKKESAPAGIPLVVINQSTAPEAQVLVDALRAEKTFQVITENTYAKGGPRPATEADARAWLHDNHQRFVVILPPDFSSDERLGLRLIYLNNPRNEIESMTVNGMLQKTVFYNLRDLLSKSLMRRARGHLGKDGFERYNRRMSEVLSESFGGDREEIYRRFNSGDYLQLDAVGGKPGTPAVSGDQGTVTPAAAADPTLRRLDMPGTAGAAPSTSLTLAPSSRAPSGATTATLTPTPERPAAAATGTTAEKEKAADDLFSRIIKIETEQVAGKKVRNPNAARLIGGYAIMFLLFAVSGFSTSFFEEKRSGIFQRLLSGRARRHHILWAKFLFCMALGMGQLTSMFLFGHFIYDLQLFDHLLPLVVMSLCASATCASFGMLIASVTNNAQAASGLATLLVLTMSAIGGAWFPISFMPAFIQGFAKLTVVYWSVEGFTNILWADYGIMRSLPSIGVLLLMALVTQLFALWRFRRSDMFE